MVQTMKFDTVEPSLSPFSFHMGPNICLRILFSDTLSLHSSLNLRDYVLPVRLVICFIYFNFQVSNGKSRRQWFAAKGEDFHWTGIP